VLSWILEKFVFWLNWIESNLKRIWRNKGNRKWKKELEQKKERKGPRGWTPAQNENQPRPSKHTEPVSFISLSPSPTCGTHQSEPSSSSPQSSLPLPGNGKRHRNYSALLPRELNAIKTSPIKPPRSSLFPLFFPPQSAARPHEIELATLQLLVNSDELFTEHRSISTSPTAPPSPPPCATSPRKFWAARILCKSVNQPFQKTSPLLR
jgi:hypothetical protein